MTGRLSDNESYLVVQYGNKTMATGYNRYVEVGWAKAVRDGICSGAKK
jgi:hypothetical protein